MSVIHNDLLLSGDDGYNLTRSLRFRRSASAYLSRTPASDGNRKTWTQSLWVKNPLASDNSIARSLVGIVQNSSQTQYRVFFDENFNLRVFSFESGSFQFNFTTTRVFRDPSAYYHIIIALDTTQATSSNRVKIYVNGSQETAFSTATYPSLNADCNWNRSMLSQIGASGATDAYLDGYLTEVNFIDGQALTPSSFGSTSSTIGVWQPKRYTGTYGTNGFYLPFTDNSALTSGSNAGLGKDFSGNGNYWTTNNISITSGSTYDSMTDVPTLTSATAANFCTLNPLVAGTTATITNGNLSSTGSTTTFANARASFLLSSGKWYWEQTITGSSTFDIGIGLCTDSSIKSSASNIRQTGWYNIINGSSGDVGTSANGGSNTTVGTTNWATNDVIMVAYDASTGYIWFGRNGTWYPPTNGGSAGNPSAGTNQTISAVSDLIPASWHYNTNAGSAVNFGQRPFAYTPPTGFVALNTYNLPTPSIGATASSQANKYFDAKTYTGTGGTQTITGFNFQPDLVWVKNRSNPVSHALIDAVRTAPNQLGTDLTAAENSGGNAYATYGGVSAFTSDGFTATSGTDATYKATNGSGQTYVAWNWKANGSGSSNTAGSITSTVSANTTSGFSIVTWTGNGSTGTVGHGLGVAPKMIITKERSAAGNSWPVWFSGATSGTQYLYLNGTNAIQTSTNYWNSTVPTSTVFSVGNDSATNGTGTHVAYCFAEIAGFSKFGSYTGNGSTDGPMIFTGFKPKYVLIKASSTTGGWNVVDSARSPSNVVDDVLFPNLSDAEGTFNWLDFTSNGFKIRNTLAGSNTSGTTYIYMAFAEVPQKFALGV